MAISPLSVQLSDKIVTEERERDCKLSEEIRNAGTIMEGMIKAAALQVKLGLGNPALSVQRNKKEMDKMARMNQAEKLAQHFKAVKEPNEKFFPRFKKGNFGNASTGTAKGRLPELICAELGVGIDRCRVEMQGTLKPGQSKNYEASIPVIPPTVLELASRAKTCAPDAEFHLLFMPSWEPAPQRDPVLLAHITGTDEWFEIGCWDGDVDLIKEFLEDR